LAHKTLVILVNNFSLQKYPLQQSIAFTIEDGNNNIITDQSISKLTKLTDLNLGMNNKITDQGISKLTNLTILDLGFNNNISHSIAYLTNLTKLTLHKHNNINDDIISKLTNLKELDSWAVSSYLKSVQFFIKTIIVIIKNVYFSDVLYLRIPFNFALKTLIILTKSLVSSSSGLSSVLLRTVIFPSEDSFKIISINSSADELIESTISEVVFIKTPAFPSEELPSG
jgi:hypothetical protein